MSKRTPASYKKHPPTHGAKVETNLAALQNHHRLAIHCFEAPDEDKFYPDETLKYLKGNEQAPLPELICDSDKAAILSLSLLPRVGASIEPYACDNVSYLFDLRTRDKRPPLVVRVLEFGGGTSSNVFFKNLSFDSRSRVEALRTLYASHTDVSFKKAVAENPHLSEKQLDALGDYYDHSDERYHVPFNEVLAAVTQEHIAAIAVSFNPERRMCKPFEILKGSLAGFAHAQHGIDLPVVMYHIKGDQQGACTYIAQGQEECRAKAIEAVREIQKNNYDLGPYYRWHAENNLYYACKTLLGIDVEKPIDAQLATGRV